MSAVGNKYAMIPFLDMQQKMNKKLKTYNIDTLIPYTKLKIIGIKSRIHPATTVQTKGEQNDE